MTPAEFAANLARSDSAEDQALGVAIITRGVTDDTPERAGWPLDAHTVRGAARHLGISEPSDALVARALALAPTISDAMLNKGAADR